MAMPETLHKLGMIIDGTRGLFQGCIEDGEFHDVVSGDFLPVGWFAVHVTAGELDGDGGRVALLRRMPTILRRGVSGWEPAPWRESLERAKATGE